jgi:hypothetical protein
LPEEGGEDTGGGWREWFGIGDREEPDPAKRVPEAPVDGQ